MFKIITKNDDFVVVSKAAGVNFHDEGELGSGLFSQVKNHLIQQSEMTELFPVHRLDKMTSGLIIFATNSHSAKIFGELFQQHKVEKYYLAISDKKPTKKQGLIKGDMNKSRRGMFKLMRTMQNPAITQFFSYGIGNKQRLYILKPHSGKTHQLRVALGSIAAPILGDPLYHPTSTTDRGYLHAYALKFELLGKTFQFILPPDEGTFYFSEQTTKILAEIKQPWLLPWPKI